ncbi:MAG: type II toxin-antitoxin system Phd/YefM family antitoxin [Promicromonosporaceae bacterium]|nr:type II toxin-antitoxin system Phd/YefM family antitoxin [Promicromonosporaceae bacterium]
MTITEARANLAEVVDQARIDGSPVYLTRRDKPVAAVIDISLLESLLQRTEAVSVTERLNAAWAADPERHDLEFATFASAQMAARIQNEEW